MSREWVAATTALLAAAAAAILYLACRRVLGPWLRLHLAGHKEDTVQLTKSAHYDANGFKAGSDSDVALDGSGAYRHYDNVATDVFQEVACPPTNTHLLPRLTAGGTQPPPPSDSLRPSSSEPGCREDNSPSSGSDALLLSVSESCPALRRAQSSESLCSVSSVPPEALGSPQYVGHLEVGLEYDEETEDLVVHINRGKGLATASCQHPDTYVRVFLLPDKSTNLQTRIQPRTACPEYKERFLFGVDRDELVQRTVACHVYVCERRGAQHLLGEAQLKLMDVDMTKSFVAWLPLVDPNQVPTELGDILFSLSYLPTAERLTVVIVKARNLRFSSSELGVGDPFVKVYLVRDGKKIAKKKTSIKKDERNPIFNEAMIFSVPVNALHTTHLRISVAEVLPQGIVVPIGHVVVGSGCSGKSLSHWNQMTSSLRKPVALWHPLRK